MEILINGAKIAAYPAIDGFKVNIMDLDDADSTTRTANGTLNRDRVAVKRQIEMKFPPLKRNIMATLLQQMRSSFFEINYPDPMTGNNRTITAYVGDRSVPLAINRNGELYWGDLTVVITER